jgi:hypothetical protein
MANRAFDDIFGPYERRLVALTDHDIAERRAGLMLGWELNRLQKGHMNEADRRLVDLHCTGRISREEYGMLVRLLAQVDAKALV